MSPLLSAGVTGSVSPRPFTDSMSIVYDAASCQIIDAENDYDDDNHSSTTVFNGDTSFLYDATLLPLLG